MRIDYFSLTCESGILEKRKGTVYLCFFQLKVSPEVKSYPKPDMVKCSTAPCMVRRHHSRRTAGIQHGFFS